MWKLEFRPAALAWMLAALFVVGLGTRGFQWLNRNPSDKLQIVTRSDNPLVARADSIFRARQGERSRLLNINLATAVEFERLPGIGPVLSRNIIAYRDDHGPFHSIGDLLNVSGIGEKRLAALSEHCTLDSSSSPASPH